MKTLFRKADLDTALTCLILGVGGDELVLVPAGASPEELASPDVCCVEAGGSGRVDLGNFDHHEPGTDLPPACLQALRRIDSPSTPALQRLVEYVAAVDDGGLFGLRTEFPSLSTLFSGMMLVVHDEKERVIAGMDLLRDVLELNIDPFGTMPDLPRWAGYRAAACARREHLANLRCRVEVFTTPSGQRVGFLETDVWGAPGVILRTGCDIAVARMPFPDKVRAKYTIASRHLEVAGLLPVFNAREPGWGGRRLVIGSPAGGSLLEKELIIQLTLKHNCIDVLSTGKGEGHVLA
jgi:hypothetical protein